MKGEIQHAHAEWNDSEGAFCVYLAREGDDGEADVDNAKPLRPLMRAADRVGGDPVEARIVWDALIFCPRDFADQLARYNVLVFAREAQAKRVAARANKTLAELRNGVAPLEGPAAQMAYMMKGGKARIGFSLDNLRGRIAGTEKV